MPKLSSYKSFLDKKLNEGVLNDVDNKTINNYIDEAYQHFKETAILVNTKDIMEYVEYLIGKELDDDDYIDLYYKMTGDYIEGDEIDDLDDEEKFIVQ